MPVPAEPLADFLHCAVGFIALHAIAWAMSENRRAIAWRPVLSGAVLTLALGALLLRAPGTQSLFLALNQAMAALERATRDGTSFVFGYLGGGPLPFAEDHPGAAFVLALQALPLVLVVSALSSLLFYWGVLPLVVRGFAWLLQKAMGLGGAIGLSSAANVFVGMVEAPLFVRPWIARMNRGELFVMMSCGMATIAGTVMALYASVLGSVVPGALGHILVASIIATPAVISLSLLMVPEDGPRSDAAGPVEVEGGGSTSSMDAVTRGTPPIAPRTRVIFRDAKGKAVTRNHWSGPGAEEHARQWHVFPHLIQTPPGTRSVSFTVFLQHPGVYLLDDVKIEELGSVK